MPNRTGKGGFKKGQSGNPSGRTAKSERLRRIEDMAKQHSEDALSALLDEAERGKGAPRVAAAIAILDRAWGKPVERKEAGEPGAFDYLTDAEVEHEAKNALRKAVKLGLVKVLPQQTKATSPTDCPTDRGTVRAHGYGKIGASARRQLS